ncbi:hypothetical protein CRG98_007939, partial [Punica granatum]
MASTTLFMSRPLLPLKSAGNKTKNRSSNSSCYPTVVSFSKGPVFEKTHVLFWLPSRPRSIRTVSFSVKEENENSSVAVISEKT